jgi:drug/metabolite transporter (DMT)-like permease
LGEASRRPEPERHLLGVVLVLLSALAFSLAGILTKAITADVWTILCWRGLVGGLIIAGYAGWIDRRKPLSERFRLGWRGWLLACVGSLASIAFIFAFKLTYVANVAIIYATAPFVAAGLGWLVMRERFRQRTLIAAVVSCLGIGIVVGGGFGGGSILGDTFALLMTLGSALYMVLIRKFQDSPVVLAGGASALQLFVLGWIVVDPLAVTLHDAVLLVLFGLSFAVAVVLWTEGTRLIAAAESALLGCAETPFALLLAWLILAELPPLASLLGGTVVLAAVLAHATWDVRQRLALRRQA